MKDSSFGNAALKPRTINVGANLLGEWIAERDRERREVGRYGALLGASLLVAALVLPTLGRESAQSSRQASEYRAKVAELDAALKVAEETKKAAQPGLVVKAMCVRTAGSFDRLLGELDRVLSAGSARTALASVRCDVSAGEAHLTVRADAEGDEAADAFARNAGEEGAKVDAIVSSRPSTALAPQGVGFSYEKRIGVAR